MALKRKRSTPTFSSPFSYTTSTTPSDFNSPSSLPFFYAQSKPTEPHALYQKPTWSFPTYDSDGSHDSHHNHSNSNSISTQLNSRTRKRHRDDRPDERAIYGAFQSSCIAWLGAEHMALFADFCRAAASTINKLYEAQRHLPKDEPVPYIPVRAETQAMPQKSTLHSFWKIGGNAPASTSVPMAVDSKYNSAVSLDLKCEDCDGSLRQEDAMELDEEIVEQETICSICRRQVCDKCAVLGNARICLNCASWSGR